MYRVGLGCHSAACFPLPEVKSIGPDLAIVWGCQLMPAGTEVAINEEMGGEKILGLPGRFEPLHLAFASSRWTMRILDPIIEVSALSVLDTGKQLTLSNAIALQLVGHDHPRLILQTRQQSFEESTLR